MSSAGPDFLAHRLPSMAVACPICHAGTGRECKRPSGHKAMTLHKERHTEADRIWLKLDLPTITHHPDGTFTYDGPETRPSAQRATPQQKATTTMKNRKKAKAAKGKKRGPKSGPPRIVGRLGSKTNPPRIVGSLPRRTKADELADFLRHAGGRSIDAVCAEFGWLAHSARAAISGLGTKKKIDVTTTKTDAGTIYEVKAAA